MENQSNSNNTQLPPGYMSLNDISQLSVIENVMMMTLSIMQRTENFARAQFDMLRRRGITIEYMLHSETLSDGVQVDLFVIPYKSTVDIRLVYLVLEETTKRIENFARSTMNVFRYRGLLVDHYFYHKYDEGAIHDIIAVELKGIRVDLFKKLDGKRVSLNADKILEENKANQRMGVDKRKVKEDYRDQIREENQKIKEILDAWKVLGGNPDVFNSNGKKMNEKTNNNENE